MAKMKRRIAKEIPGPAMVVVTEVETVYAFRTVVRCPRCGSTRTMVYAGAKTENPNIRYRICMTPICRWKFKEIGEQVK